MKVWKKGEKLFGALKQVVIDGKQYFNPTMEQIIDAGYEEYELEEVANEISYKDKVVTLIREKYSIDDEIAILRQRDTKKEEFDEYFAYVEKCKKQSK